MWVLGLYSSAIFCSWYRQLIIVMLAIISVTVEQCHKNSQVFYMWPYKFMIGVLEQNVHACTQPEPLLPWFPLHLFSKHKTKWDNEDVIWWIFGHVSVLKFVKDVEDDNRYSVLQIDIIFNRKYCDYTSITTNDYSQIFTIYYFAFLLVVVW